MDRPKLDPEELNPLLDSLVSDDFKTFSAIISRKTFSGFNLVRTARTQEFYVFEMDETYCYAHEAVVQSIVIGSDDYYSLLAVNMKYDAFLRILCCALLDKDFQYEAVAVDVDLSSDEVVPGSKLFGVAPDPSDFRYTYNDNGTVTFRFLGVPITYTPTTNPRVVRFEGSIKPTCPGLGILDVLFVGEYGPVATEYVVEGECNITPASQVTIGEAVRASNDLNLASIDLDYEDDTLFVPDAQLYPAHCVQNGWMTVQGPNIVQCSGPYEKGDQALIQYRSSGDGSAEPKPYICAYKKRDMSVRLSMSYYYYNILRSKKGLSVVWCNTPVCNDAVVAFCDSRFVVPSRLISLTITDGKNIQSLPLDKFLPPDEVELGDYNLSFNHELANMTGKNFAIHMLTMGGEWSDSSRFGLLEISNVEVINIMYRVSILFPCFEVMKDGKKKKLVFYEPQKPIDTSIISYVRKMRDLYFECNAKGFIKHLTEKCYLNEYKKKKKKKPDNQKVEWRQISTFKPKR